MVMCYVNSHELPSTASPTAPSHLSHLASLSCVPSSDSFEDTVSPADLCGGGRAMGTSSVHRRQQTTHSACHMAAPSPHGTRLF